ncbi:probable palmitoyltransferase ZDHHC24 [Drosophila teissieri]|uniref:probable palmitoyltransferase ZDHHC24 n=1 Tax=Drosophila teissieri TaxID=7243 RepID=UPI001CBA3323|nr:probable palmitoyltransferase ZDHHC24 [Drosophila teissieri]
MCFIWTCTRYLARRNPKVCVRISHPLAVLFVILTTFFFVGLQMFYVVPQLFDVGGMMYKLGWLLAIFIMYNIFGNMLACHVTNTSVESLPKDRQVAAPEEEHLWHYCDICEKLMPPRSWHCILCKCCILKRDHHCIFAATCIGHKNQRYFFWCTFFMALGTGVAWATHTIASLKYFIYSNLHSHNLPPFWLVFTLMLNTYALAAPVSLVIMQLSELGHNGALYDFNSDIYDMGLWENFKMIVGEKVLWTFLSPTVKSPLPHDGTQWKIKKADISEY